MRVSTRAVIGAFAMLSLGATACGGDDDVAKSDDSGLVSVAMTDNRFDPKKVEVEAGETVTFRFSNRDKVQHEAFIGSADEQDAHAAGMQDAAGGHHDTAVTSVAEGGPAVTVAPGETEELRFTFGDEGSVLIGCHEPGHYEAGMRADVDVQ